MTGTTGWLGAELAKKLAVNENINEIFGLARRPTSIEGVKSLQADITSKTDMEKIAKHEPAFDVVVHLAGAAGWCSLEQGVDINVCGTRNLLSACRKAGTKKFVVASSVAATGTSAPDYPPKALPITNEHGFVGSKWAYALSKAMVEDMVKFMGTSDPDADYLLVRIGGVVSDPPAPLKHLETAVDEEWIIDAAVASDAPKEETFPEMPLCAIALSDITRCFMLAVEAQHKPGARIISAVGPSAFSKEPVAKVVSSWYGKDKDIDLSHHQIPGNEFAPIYDTESARREIGFVAQVDLRTACLEAET